MSQEMDLTCLPLDIREKLAELDLELSEGKYLVVMHSMASASIYLIHCILSLFD